MTETLPQFEKALLTSLPAGVIPAVPVALNQATISAISEAFKKHFFCLLEEPRHHKLWEHNTVYQRSLFDYLRLDVPGGGYTVRKDISSWQLKDSRGVCLVSQDTRGDKASTWANPSMEIEVAKNLIDALCSGRLTSDLKTRIAEQEALEAADIVAYGKRLEEENEMMLKLSGLDAVSLEG